MVSQVFISHSSKDRKIARTICSALESRKLACWIASRDVRPGENFMDAIVNAINSAKVMVLVFSESANNSEEIKREIVLAGNARIPVIPVRVEDVAPKGAFAYQLATRQWIDLFEDWESQIERLAGSIGQVVSPGMPAVAPVQGADSRAEPGQEFDRSDREPQAGLTAEEAAPNERAAAEAQLLAGECRAETEGERRVREAEAAQVAEIARNTREAEEAGGAAPAKEPGDRELTQGLKGTPPVRADPSAPEASPPRHVSKLVFALALIVGSVAQFGLVCWQLYHDFNLQTYLAHRIDPTLELSFTQKLDNFLGLLMAPAWLPHWFETLLLLGSAIALVPVSIALLRDRDSFRVAIMVSCGISLLFEVFLIAEITMQGWFNPFLFHVPLDSLILFVPLVCLGIVVFLAARQAKLWTKVAAFENVSS